MKISFILPANYFNGGIRVIGIVATELDRRGHDVRLFSQPQKRYGLKYRVKRFLQTGALPPHPQDGPFLDSIKSKVRVLDRRRPVVDADLPDADVVIATWWQTSYWVDALSLEKGAKVYFMQDYGASGQELEKIAPTWALQTTFVTLTDTLRSMIRDWNPSADVTVVRNAVDHRVFHSEVRKRGTPPRIGFMYRRPALKGATTALQALEQIRTIIPELSVVAVSPTDADLPDWVEVVSAPDDAGLCAVYRSCDLWLFPSRMEGFGLPIVEAMACRTPVISTRVGGAPDLIRDGDNGFLVDVDDAEAMAEKAIALLSAPEAVWDGMSDKAWRTVADYSWSDAVDLFEDALQRAARQRA